MIDSNTSHLRLHGVGHMVKHHSDSERGNLLPPHGLLFAISSNGCFICTIPQTIFVATTIWASLSDYQQELFLHAPSDNTYISCGVLAKRTVNGSTSRDRPNDLLHHGPTSYYAPLEKEGNILFNNASNTFYLWLYDVGHMVNDHSDRERKPATATWATLPDKQQGFFICTIPTG